MATGAPDRTRSKGHPPQSRGRDDSSQVESKDDPNKLEDGGRFDAGDPRSILRLCYITAEGDRFDAKVEGSSSTVVVVAAVLGEAACAGLAAYHPAAASSIGLGAAAIFGMVALYIRKRR